VVAAHIQLQEFAEAVTKSEQFLETHPESEVLWSFYADALQRSGRLNDAIVALDRVLTINPSHPNAALRQGSWLVQDGRATEAVAKLTAYVAQNPAQADQAGRILFADAHSNGYQKENYAYALTGFTAAKSIPGLSPGLTTQLNFWHGITLYTQALPRANEQTLASAQATLPAFQSALRLLDGTQEYARTNSINLQQFLDATRQWIEINEAIIQRGR
jgi:tetratricopeptide (TPR) repeat protein